MPAQVRDSEITKMLNLWPESLLQPNEGRSELDSYKRASLTQFHKLRPGSIAASFSTRSHREVVNVPRRQAQHCSHHAACYLQQVEAPAVTYDTNHTPSL